MRWIKIHDKITEWRWWNDNNTLTVWIHILMSANWKDKYWKKVFVPRGSFITSREHLASECGLTVDIVRRVLDNLQSTGEITKQTTNKYTMITVCNYDNYQGCDNEETPTKTQQIPNKNPTNPQQIPTTIEYKNNRIIEDNKETSNIVASADADTTARPNEMSKSGDKEKAADPYPFDVIWNMYGKKTDKMKCQRKWNNMPQRDKKLIFERVPAYVASTPEIQYRKNFYTYLNGQCWNDDILSPQNNLFGNNTQPIEYTDENRPHHFKQGGKYWNANQKRWFDE